MIIKLHMHRFTFYHYCYMGFLWSHFYGVGVYFDDSIPIGEFKVLN